MSRPIFTAKKNRANIFEIVFGDEEFSERVFSKFAGLVQEHPVLNKAFGPVPDDLLADLWLRARGTPPSASPSPAAQLDPIDLRSVRSMFGQIVKQRIFNNAWKYDRLSADPTIIGAYKNAPDKARAIIEIAGKLAAPPFRVFRKIVLTANIMSPAQFRDLARSPDQVAKQISPDDLAAYRSASDADANSTARQSISMQVAQKKEDNFVGYFRDVLGIPIRTQQELFDDALAAGTTPITPDVLFESSAIINGRPARWIDFKGYCCAPIPFITASNAEQADRYERAFGPGVLCFELGVVRNAISARSVSARGLIDTIIKGADNLSDSI